MKKESIVRIGNIISSIYKEDVQCANSFIMRECKASNEFYKKYESVLNPDMGRKKYPYFVKCCEEIMKNSKIRKEILDYVSSSCIEYDDKDYNVIVKYDEDSPAVKDILREHTATITSKIIRTETFVYGLLLDNKTMYLQHPCIDFITEEFGEKYAIYEVLLILINYFIKEKGVYVDKAIRISLNIVIMLYFNEIDMIFKDDRLPYYELYYYFLRHNVHNMTFNTEKLLSICTMYRDIKDGIII